LTEQPLPSRPESIYRTLFVQTRGVLRRELTQYLRTGRVLRRPKGVRLPDGRGARPNTLHISERPAEAEDRAVPGHWEGDLVFGKNMSPLATLVERSTRYLMLVALPRGDHQADAVADALGTAITRLPRQLAKSLTWDLGHERPLPAPADIDRIAARAGSLYAAAPTRPNDQPSHDVRRSITAVSTLGSHVRPLAGAVGHVRARISDGAESWEVAVSPPALRLK
jgi:hypothetical protein